MGKQARHSLYPQHACNIFRDNKKQFIALWLENCSDREVKSALEKYIRRGYFPDLRITKDAELSEKSRHR